MKLLRLLALLDWVTQILRRRPVPGRTAVAIIAGAAFCGLPSIGLGQSALRDLWCYASLSFVQGVAYSHDGSKVAAAGYSALGLGGVQIYSPSSGTATNCIPTLTLATIQSVSFSPDDTQLAVGGTGYDGTGAVEVWNVQAGTMIASFPTGATGGVQSVAFSPDGTLLADGGSIKSATTGELDGGVVELWNVAAGNLLSSLPTSATEVNSVAFSPSGNLLADGGGIAFVGTPSGVIEIWNVSTGKLSISLNSAAYQVNSVAFTPDGSSLAAGGLSFTGSGGVLELWNVASVKLSASFTPRTLVNSVAFTPDGKTLIDGGYASYLASYFGMVELWDVGTGMKTNTLDVSAFESAVNSVAVSPNGSDVTVGGFIGNSNGVGGVGVFETWTVASGQFENGANTSLLGGDPLILAPSGTMLAGVPLQNNYSLVVWNQATTAAPLVLNPNGYINALAFSADGNLLASGESGANLGVLDVWDAVTGQLKASLPTSATGFVSDVAFSSDGQFLADQGQCQQQVGGPGAVVELWSLSSGSLVASLNTAVTSAGCVALSPDGKTLADGGPLESSFNQVGVLELWNLPTDTLAASLKTSILYVSSLKFSPTGAVLATCGEAQSSDGASTWPVLEFWDVATGKLLATPAFAAGTQWTHQLQFSPDGTVLFVATDVGIQAFSTLKDELLVNFDGGLLALGAVSLSLPANGSVLAYNTDFGAVISANPYYGNWLTALLVSPSSVEGGSSAIGTVTIAQAAPIGGMILPLTSSSSAASVPSWVAVGAGQTNATFTVSTTSVSTETTVAISGGTTGNSISASLTITPPGLSSLTLDPVVVGGGATTVGTVTLTGPAGTGGVNVTLSINSANATVPSSVTVPAGAGSTTFTITTTGLASTATATVTATLNGQSKSAVLTINPPSLALVGASPSRVPGGMTSTGTISLSAEAPTAGYSVTLTSSNPAVLVPGLVTVAQGQNSASFTITTTAVRSETVSTLTAQSEGISKTASITVLPPSLVSIVLNPTTIAGGVSSTGTVTLSGPAPTGGTSVKLATTLKYATVPPSVAVVAGATTAAFDVKTVSVPAQQTATISAMLGTTSKTATLTITLPALVSLAVSPPTVSGGTPAVGTVGLSGPAHTAVSIALSSGSKSATVPKVVTVAAGKTTATFTVKTVSVDSLTTATLTAIAESVSRSTTLTIEPPTVKSLVLEPSSVAGGKSSSGTVTITSAAPPGGLSISISSSNSAATAPSAVTIPAGRTSVSFTVKSAKVTSSSTATITAAFGGSTARAVLTVKS